MLEGDGVTLRLVRENDLSALHEFEEDIANRGDFFPVGVQSFQKLVQEYGESGLWSRDEGVLVITDDVDTILGHIEFFPTVAYLDEIELSYILYSSAHRGGGIATQAVRLLTGYLFNRLKVNRIRLVIHPDNTASRRVAEKSGYTLEGVARGAWYHRGHNQDVEIWAVLRSEHPPS